MDSLIFGFNQYSLKRGKYYHFTKYLILVLVIIVTDYILERGNFRVFLPEEDNLINEILQFKLNDEWIPILSNMSGFSTLQMTEKDEVISKKFNFLKSKKKKIYFQLNDEDFDMKLDYCLEEDNILHIRYQIFANRNLSFSKLGVKYQILLKENPDFSWVPHICPKESLVIGDHVFRSPVLIYKKENIAFAFIPDLKTLSQNRPFQTFLDMNLDTSNEKIPHISYEFGNYHPYRHVLFKHKKSQSFQVKEQTNLTFRYYLIIFEDKTESEIIQFINKFLWEKYGRCLFYETLEPQVLPYDVNVKEGLEAIFNRHSLWGDLKINNVNCGGFWVGSWLGNDKFPFKFFSNSNIDEFKNNFNKKNKPAAIYNIAWFLNIRSSYGIRYFGEIWDNQELIAKSRAMRNLIAQLPRKNGIFPSIILPSSNNTSEYLTVSGTKAWWPIDYFHVVDVALSMYWLIKIAIDFNDINEEVIEKSKELASLIKNLQFENGEIPTFVDFDKNNEPIIVDDLKNSASSGASLMFLTEYYRISQDNTLIDTCERIANFLSKEIIPNNKWFDVEAFYSCTYPQKYKYDERTHSFVMNNLSIYWCAEGFLGLYQITLYKKYLDEGERILGVLSLFQQVWNMPYISYNTFGGFGVQNADAELSDARQGLFVKTYMDYYLETGKWEYMERGIAALRASWALQLLKEYRNICPGNLKGIDTIEGIDKGCISENYGHFGRDERIPGFITFDWGVGTAILATSYARKHFGDLFIDFKKEFVFGIDGILIKKFNFDMNRVAIEFEITKGKEEIIIKGRIVSSNQIELVLNNNILQIKNCQNLLDGLLYKF